MKPEHRLIGIIGAMDSELETLLAAMTEKKQETLYGLTFTTGTLDGCAVVLVKAGIGKVNAARCTQLLIDRFSPSAIVNTGIAGGLAPGLSVGDVVVAAGVLQHDFDVTAFGHAKGYLCTGSSTGFIGLSPFRFSRLTRRFPAALPQPRRPFSAKATSIAA